MRHHDPAYPYRADADVESGLTCRDRAAIELFPIIVVRFDAALAQGLRPAGVTQAAWCASETYRFVDALIAESQKAPQ